MTIDPRIRARRVAVRRQEGRRRLRFLVGAVALVALAVGAWVLTRTPLLDLDHVRYEGVSEADARLVEATTGLETGAAMFDLDLGAVERQLVALPWVASASAEREWPGTIRVTVESREPVAVVGELFGGPAFLADAEGVILRPAGADSELPRVAVVSNVGLGEVEERALPGIHVAMAVPLDLLPWIEAVTIESASLADERPDLGLDLVGTAGVHLGAGDFIDDKLAALRAILEGTDLSCVDLIDVAVADLPTMTRDERCDFAGASGTVSGDA